MSKLKLVKGELDTKVRDQRATELQREIDSKISLTYKDHLVYAYHFLSMGLPQRAKHHLTAMNAIYWNSHIFKDLYRSLLAEALLKLDPYNQELHREYEFFIVVKRLTVMLRDVDFDTKFAFIGFADEFETYSSFSLKA